MAEIDTAEAESRYPQTVAGIRYYAEAMLSRDAFVAGVAWASQQSAAAAGLRVTREAVEGDDIIEDLILLDQGHMVDYDDETETTGECVDDCPGCALDRVRAALGVTVADEVQP